jgi:hypothetical protein
MRPTDPRFRETCDTFRACFRRSAALHDTPIEIVEVLFESKSLPGYFMRADVGDEKRPTVVDAESCRWTSENASSHLPRAIAR